MIIADNSKSCVTVDGTAVDGILELNGIFDNFISYEPEILLGVITAWSDKLQEYTVRDKVLYRMSYSISERYLDVNESEGITSNE